MQINKSYIKRSLWASSILLTALLTGCNSGSDGSDDSSTAISGPTVIATSPADSEKVVPLNHKVVATFSEEMNASTINTQSFSVKDDKGVAVIGEVTFDAASNSAIFTPDINLTPDTDYTATLTTAITSTADVTALTEDYIWHFTSGTATDDDAPTVISTIPADEAPDVLLNRAISANFSELLDPATVNEANFTLSETVSKTAVVGVVSYGGTVANFTPNDNLLANTKYTATLTTGITDAADNALVDSADNEWTFTTGSAAAAAAVKGPKPVNLGTAGDFVILTKTGITNVFKSTITGNIGSSPITAAAMNTVSCPEISGNIYGVDTGLTTGCYIKNDKAKNAVFDMAIAYTDAAGRTNPDATELYAGDLSGRTLAPGLYKWSSNVLINTDVTLSGGANDVWIFQIAGDLIQASNTQVTLMDGALAKNIFWQVGGGTSVALNTGAVLNGIVLAEKAITLKTGATVNGRLLAKTEVTLQKNIVTEK